MERAPGRGARADPAGLTRDRPTARRIGSRIAPGRVRRDRRAGRRLLRPLHALLRPGPGRVPAPSRPARHVTGRARVRDARPARRVPRPRAVRRRARGVRARARGWAERASPGSSRPERGRPGEHLASVDPDGRLDGRRGGRCAVDDPAARRGLVERFEQRRSRREPLPADYAAVAAEIERIAGDEADSDEIVRRVVEAAARPARHATRGSASTSSRATSSCSGRGRAERDRARPHPDRPGRLRRRRRERRSTEIVDDVNADARYLACFPRPGPRSSSRRLRRLGRRRDRRRLATCRPRSATPIASLPGARGGR